MFCSCIYSESSKKPPKPRNSGFILNSLEKYEEIFQFNLGLTIDAKFKTLKIRRRKCGCSIINYRDNHMWEKIWTNISRNVLAMIGGK